MHGVEGCVLEDHHDLGPFSTGSLDTRCICQRVGWDKCPYCCWAFPVDQGIWMEDWNEPLLGAIPAAQMAAATPITRAMLDLCSRDVELPFSGSPKAMARLLDIAILTCNQTATVNLSKKCQLRPLRRWTLQLRNNEGCWEAAITALWAGADFQGLMVEVNEQVFSNEDVPFPQALFLKSGLEDWQEIRHLLPRCHDLWSPRNLDNNLGFYLMAFPLQRGKLSLDKIRAAEDAGVAVRFISKAVSGGSAVVTLLDMAIWCGQSDCAKACVDGGIELRGDDFSLAWHKGVLRGESLPGVRPNLHAAPSEAQTAAAAAACAWLKRLWKSESSQKGIVLYQMMLKMFKGRPFPMALVQETLTYSMPVPKIIDQLDLWEHVGDWMAVICGGPSSVHAVADCSTAKAEEPEGVQDNGEAGTLLDIEVLVLFFIVCFQEAR